MSSRARFPSNPSDLASGGLLNIFIHGLHFCIVADNGSQFICDGRTLVHGKVKYSVICV